MKNKHPISLHINIFKYMHAWILNFLVLLFADKIFRPADYGSYGHGSYGRGGHGYGHGYGYGRRGADTGRAASDLVVIAIAHAFALFSAVAASINISGGHVNPAVTFGALLGGRISLIRAFFYWVAQILGAIVASLLLRLATGGMVKQNTHARTHTHIYTSASENGSLKFYSHNYEDF